MPAPQGENNFTLVYAYEGVWWVLCGYTTMTPFFSFNFQVGEDSVRASHPVLAGLGGHVGWSHRDHRAGPSVQARPRDELVEQGAPVPNP